ncbi:GNAT family N-acetyltransferase [Lentimicrobium sp. S6]|uniref:GNAT family N-acetyltransferase n=1 Tax=Lentimicrobium sp. S6 TaxID=2735872 RepID=UPI001554A84B|nr:GNAT family N-acetyltransferase [Lentimicrobium sp. S6]NPD47293.1 GNAT family N-acetyltransferase [Lentimicrobium sp. S6]
MKKSVPDFQDKIARLKKLLQHRNPCQQINEKIIQKTIDHIEYEKKYLKSFQQLNEEWLNSYLELTEHDIQVLSDPINEIINKEGKIFLLKIKEEVIGTYVLQKVNNKACELQKFTIKEKYRGQKLGKMMLDKAIENALKQKYSAILLFTTTELAEATNLYKNKGFEVITNHPELIDKTGRQSICMQLNIHE